MRALLLLATLLPLAVPTAFAERGGFYFRGQEGWFWYEREPEPPPEPKPALESPPQPPQVFEAAPAGPKPLSAEWLRERLGAYRDAPIDDPTRENVALCLYLQRPALDRSTRFAAAQQAVQFDPFLDEITQRPTATFAANLVNRKAGDGRNAALTDIAKQAGVLFFFRSDCPYCEAQAPLLRILEARYGFSVLPVSLDGAPLPGGHFPEYRRDSGQAQRLGVVSTPALFLVRPPDDMVPLSQGLLSLAQLQERLLIAAAQAGCGGIDLFAGSFSFISAGQFDNLLRAIAANAAGCALEVALGAMRAGASAHLRYRLASDRKNERPSRWISVGPVRRSVLQLAAACDHDGRAGHDQ